MRMAAEGALKLFEACKEIVGDQGILYIINTLGTEPPIMKTKDGKYLCAFKAYIKKKLVSMKL